MTIVDTPSRLDALGTARTFIRLVRALEQHARHAETDSALTFTELGVLGQIDRGQNLPSMLARAQDLDPARVTRITDRLFALGYIEREADPEDRRRCRLRLTASGAERLRRGRADFADAMASLLAGLTEEEEAALQLGTEGLRRVLDQQTKG